MTTVDPHTSGPTLGPPVPGTEGTGSGPGTAPSGPSTTPLGPSPVPVPGPSTAGTGTGTGGTQSPVPGPSTAGTRAGTGTGTRGTESPVPVPRTTRVPSRSQSHPGTGPSRRSRGTGSQPAKIAGSRLIPGTTISVPRGKITAALSVVTIALTLVIAAPTLLSSQDLYHWAKNPHGLGLTGYWPLLVPMSLDLAAIVCIGMTLVAAWRGERANGFALLVWVFAGASAYAQYTFGVAEKLAGRAQDRWWMMPFLALVGPLLLELTLHTIRRWSKDPGQTASALRWLVSPWRSIAAWAYALRENLTPAEAWVFGRDRKLLKKMRGRPVDAIRFAADATQSLDPYVLRQWLAARGTIVSQADLDDADLDSVPTDLWDTGDQGPDPAGPEGPGPVPAVPVPPPPPSGPPAGPWSPGGWPSVPGPGEGPGTGTDRSPAGTGGGTEGPVPSVPAGTGTEGTEGLRDWITGTEVIPSAVDGRNLVPLYERHRERLRLVKTNLPTWAVMPEAELKTDAIKTAGGFKKQEYACEVRRILVHERALAQPDN